MSPLVAFFLTLVALSSQPTPAPSYAAARTAAIANCDAIDANAYQSGLAFNPDGYRSYYTQSACVQRAAVRFRDLELCGRVRQRRALFSSSWGYSPANCRTLVTQGVEADRRELEEIRRQYQSGVVVLRDFTLRRNGNGRDYEVLPAFEGVNGHGYIITVDIVGEDGKASPFTATATTPTRAAVCRCSFRCRTSARAWRPSCPAGPTNCGSPRHSHCRARVTRDS